MMNMLTVLTWFTSKKDYLKPFADSESAKKAATKLWADIDKGDLLLLILMAIITISLCYYYYFPFNEKPGRHYHPKWCAMYCLVAVILVFLLSFAGCCFIAKNPGFDYGFLAKVSALNMVYSLLLYFILSIFMIKSGKSNAYPWI